MDVRHLKLSTYAPHFPRCVPPNVTNAGVCPAVHTEAIYVSAGRLEGQACYSSIQYDSDWPKLHGNCNKLRWGEEPACFTPATAIWLFSSPHVILSTARVPRVWHVMVALTVVEAAPLQVTCCGRTEETLGRGRQRSS